MDRIRITDLFVEKVGPFVKERFHFPDKQNEETAETHLFVGENGVGKSTLLLMLSCVFPNDQIYKRFHHGDEDSKFKICFSNGEEYVIKPRRGNTDFSSPPRLLSEYHNRIGNPAYNSFDFAFFAYSGFRNLTTETLPFIQELTSNPFENALNFRTSTDPMNLIQWVANLKTKEALALAKNEKERANAYKRSINIIEDIVSKITDKSITFELEEDPLNVVIRMDNHLLEFDLLPDGLKSIISWISDLLMRLDRTKWNNSPNPLDRNFILFLDEIDVHLHPAWQRKILPIIHTIFKNSQIFLTTHSPFVVGSTDGAWIHTLGFKSNNTSTQLGEPILSDDSKSYTLVLNEIFNIKNYFGVDVEAMIDEFRQLRNKIIHARQIEEADRNRLRQIVEYFRDQKSLELDNMIGMEIMQLSKVTGFNDIL